MSISREQIEAAVEQYLPRTINFARDAGTGLKDRDATFERAMQILVTALLLDEDTIFYIIFLATQRWKTTLESAKSKLVDLQSQDQLRGVIDTPPTRIEDLSKLEDAKARLTFLGGSLRSGDGFGSVHFEDFKEDISTFLADQVVPNVAVRNRAAVKRDLISTATGLTTTWEALLSQREQVFSALDELLARDVQALASASVIESIELRIASLLTELAESSTAEQAEDSETILIDLAAGRAALQVIGDAPTVEGTVTAGPAVDGSTPKDYLEAIGQLRTEPVSFAMKGTEGKLSFDLVTFAETGESVDDTDGDSVTPTFQDTALPDFDALGVEPGMFLTVVPLGRSYGIEAVVGSVLTVSPEVPVGLTAVRYIITEEIPGTFFLDGGTKTYPVRSGVEDIWDGTDTTATTGLFWDVFSGADTGSTSKDVTGPPAIDGKFVRNTKALGTGGTNLYASGTTGEVRTTIESGADGDVDTGVNDQIFNSAGATFITNGVEPGDELDITTVPNVGTFIVDVVLSETSLLITGILATASTMSYTVKIPEDVFVDPAAAFLTDGVATSDTLRIVSGTPVTYDGTPYTVVSVLSQTRLTVAGLPPFTSSASSITWEFRLSTSDFADPAAAFLSSDLVAGDIIDITGEGPFPILSVDSQTLLTVDGTFATPGFDGVTWSVYPVEDTTLIFNSASATLETDEVGPLMDAALAVLEVADNPFNIALVTSETELVIIRPAAGVDGATGGVGTQFTSASATFLTSIPNTAGVPDFPVAVIITGEGTFVVSTVVSDTELTLAAAATGNLGDQLYTVKLIADVAAYAWDIVTGTTTTAFIDTSLVPDFTDYDVNDIIVLNPGTASEERAAISEVVSASEVVLASPVDANQIGIAYAIISKIKPGMELVAADRRSQIVDIVDGTTLKLDPPFPQVIGVDVAYIIVNHGTSAVTNRLVDLSAAFTVALIGLSIDLMLDQPVKAKITGVPDAVTLEVDITIPIGKRLVTYRILTTTEDTATTFVTAADTSSVVLEDILTIWRIANTFIIEDLVGLGVSPTITANLTDQEFVIVQGGSVEHGRYLLLEDKNTGVIIDADTGTLELNVAEVLSDFGADVTAILSGAAPAAVIEDGDDDGESPTFQDTTQDFVAAATVFGDRLTVVLDIGGTPTEFRTFVTAVATDTLTVEPELLQETVISWVLDRNSVSFALKEANRLQGQIQDMLDVLEDYSVPVNATIRSAFAVLEDQKMDRAAALLSAGRVEDFFAMSATDSSYASTARASIQSVGGSLDTSSSAGNITGAAANRDASVSDGTTATSSSMFSTGEEVDTVVALSNAVGEITSTEKAQTATEVSQEEIRNRAIYELVGEVETDAISDQDSTLPWIEVTGSKKDRLIQRQAAAEDALDYIINHPEEFGLEDE